MSKISRRTLAKTTVRLLRAQPTRRAQIVKGVAAYLVAHKQTNQLHLLMRDIARELHASEGHLLAEVSSAFALDAATRKQLSTYLQKATGATTIELSEQVQPDLLAGLVVQTADAQLDTSAKTKLTRLASLNLRGS